ncbi:protein takeout-like [Bacillus rossius redtenbacheri]|uniref:protein takeout-like n=1 Tax=Bacillus rossius redtenbacheri TaxID=93214 RepID=UPI002FDC8D49
MRTILTFGSCAAFLLLQAPPRATALKLPPYIKPCSAKDPLLDECSKRHGNDAIPYLVKGDPQYKIPVLDPLVVEELRLEDTSKTSATSLTIVISNMTIRGLARARILGRRHNFEKRSIFTDFVTPQLDVTAEYDLAGKLLSLPIKGHGDTDLTIYNLRVLYDMEYDLIKKKNGKKYYHMKNNDMSYNVTGGHIHLTNLFNGDKELGDRMNEFLNENFMDVFAQVGPSVAESMNELFKRLNGHIFNFIPFDEFYTDLPSE